MTKQQRIDQVIAEAEYIKKSPFFYVVTPNYTEEKERLAIEKAISKIENEYKEQGDKHRIYIFPVELENGDKYEVVVRGKKMRIVAKRLTRKQIKPDRIKKVVIEKARNNNKVEDIFVYEMDWDYSRVPLEV